MADNVYDALRQVPDPQARAIRFLHLSELDFPDAMPDFITHAELQARVTTLANAFRDLAGNDAPVVTVLAPSTIGGLTGLLAAEVAGAAHPVNWLLDADAIADCMASAGAQIVVTPGPHPALNIHDKLMQIADRLPDLRAIVSTGPAVQGGHRMRDLIKQYPADRLLGRQPAPDDLAALFHTAGTTGKSKIVPLSHRNLLAAANGIAEMWQMDQTTRIVNALPFFHVAGANLLSLGPLCRGAEVLLLTEAGLRNPAVLARHWEIVEACRPTIIGAIPSSLMALLEVPLNGADISSVLFCATGGAPMPAAAARDFERQFGLGVHTIYGMTETAGLIAAAPADRAPEYGTAGRLAPGIQTRIRPLDQAEPTDDAGAVGAICVKGAQLFGGYQGQPEDAAALLPGGWLDTGDIGSVSADGVVTISGRSKDVIIRAGNNIDPAVIEDAASSLAEVADCAAVAMPDRYAGEVPALYVVPRPNQTLSPATLERHLRGRLAEPHARPAQIFVVEKLPLTAVGKVSRVVLRQMAARAAVDLALAAEGLAPDLQFDHAEDGALTIRSADDAALPGLRNLVERLGLRAEVVGA